MATKEKYQLKRIIGTGTQEILLVDDITFTTPVFKVLDVEIDVEITDCEVCDGKVIFNGRMTKNIIYKGPINADNEGDVRYREFIREFAGMIPIENATTDDECEVLKAEVHDDCELFIPTERDADGNIIAATEKVIVDVEVKVVREVEVELAEDC